MKRVLLLLVVFTASLYGFGIGVANCDVSDVAMTHCASILFDRNKDGVITLEELNKSFEDRVKFTSNLNGTIIMGAGDVNGDGVLTIDDWTHPNRTYLKDIIAKEMACFWCRQNGVNMNMDARKREAFEKALDPQAALKD